MVTGPGVRPRAGPGGGAARAVVAGLGVAYPPTIRQDESWQGFFTHHYAGAQHPLAKRVFANAGVVTRHSVVNPLVEDVSGWSTGQRMERYQAEAGPLGKEAVTRALAEARVSAGQVGLFVVCSCTGYVTPGLDILLARDLEMAPGTRRLFVGHMGCYAALPALGAASDYVSMHGRPAVLLCVELATLHLQPPTRDPQQIVVHALFSDAAAAVVLVPTAEPADPEVVDCRPAGGLRYSIRDIRSVTDATTAGYMTWEVTDLGFRMGLSPKVPGVLSAYLPPLVDRLLSDHGLTHADVDGWAVHPGGPRILDVVRERLDLTAGQLLASRDTLAAHGNCSSSTVLLILDELRRQVTGPPRTVVALAFGPGLTLFAALLTELPA